MKKILIEFLCVATVLLGADETFFWSEALNQAIRWRPAGIKDNLYNAKPKSSNEYIYMGIPNQDTIRFEIQKTPGQKSELRAVPVFPLQPVESLAGAERISFELELQEPSPTELIRAEIRLCRNDFVLAAIPFEIKHKGRFEKISLQLPPGNYADSNLIELEIATDEDKLIWQLRKAVVSGSSGTPMPAQKVIDTVLAVRPLAPCAMFYASEEPAFNFVIPVKARYLVRDAYGKAMMTGEFAPGRNTLKKLPCGFYLLTLEAPDLQFTRVRNFCVVSDRIELPEGVEPPYAIDAHFDAGQATYQMRPNYAFPGMHYEQIINATIRAGFHNARVGVNYQRDSDYNQQTLFYAREMKKMGVCVTQTVIPCGGDTSPLKIYEYAQRVAKDFRGITSYIEFWNEPQAFGCPLAWNYAASAKAFYQGIKSVSSEMKVLTASFLSPIYASSALKSGLSEFFDAFCTHVYDGIEGYDKKIAAYRNVLEKHGQKDCFIHITECNSYSEGYAKEIGYCGEKFKFLNFEQEMAKAVFFVKSQLSMQENGIAATHSFSLPPLHEWSGNKDWGMMRDDYSARPVLAAFSVLNTLLAPAKYLGSCSPAPGVKGHLFRHIDGTQTLAYWRETESAPQTTRDTLTLKLDNGSYCFRDMLGTPRTIKVDFGKVKLPLSEFPAYISGFHEMNPSKRPLIGKQSNHKDCYDRDIILDIAAKEGLKNSKQLFVATPEAPAGKIEVMVNNIGTKTKRGTVSLSGAVKTVTSSEIFVEPMSQKKIELPVEFALPGNEIFGDLVAVGNFDDKPTSPAVIPICAPAPHKLMAVPFPGADQSERWVPGAAGPSKITQEGNAVVIEATVPHEMNSWIYPRLHFQKGTLRNVIGFEFEMQVDEETIREGYQNPGIYFNNSRMEYTAPASPGWTRIYAYWHGIVPDPADIDNISIGFNTRKVGSPVIYKLRNIKLLYQKK